MQVVLDSNVIISDFECASEPLQTLIREASRGGLDLYIPEVVIQEIVNKFRERTSDLRSEVIGKVRNSRALVDVFRAAEAVSIDSEVAGYEARLRAILDKARATYLPLPTVEHQVLLDRALARKKPFSGSKDGYRDALIWHNILERCQTGVELVFVSANWTDFGTKSKEGSEPELSPELAEEIAAANQAIVRWFTTVRQALTYILRPSSDLLSTLQRRADNDQEWRDAIIEKLIDSIEPQEVDLPHNFAPQDEHLRYADELGFVTAYTSAAQFQVIDVRVSSDRKLATVVFELEADADYDYHIPRWGQSPRAPWDTHRRAPWDDPDEDDIASSGSTTLTSTFTIDGIYDIDTSEFLSFECAHILA